MHPIRSAAARAAVLVLLFATVQGAGLGPDISTASKRPVPARPTTVNGVAWTSANTPLAGAKAQLRDASTGELQSVAIADAQGRFSFANVDAGSYVIELVAEGKIVAVGNLFTIQPGETVAAFIRLGPQTPWLTAFFSNAASAGLAAASSIGITGVVETGSPVSR